MIEPNYGRLSEAEGIDVRAAANTLYVCGYLTLRQMFQVMSTSVDREHAEFASDKWKNPTDGGPEE